MRLLAGSLALGIALFSAAPALACGGLFCQNTPVDQAGERILFATDGQNVTAHVQIQYQGAAKDFSWIVPVPTAPKLAVGSDLLFRKLREATRPTFQLEVSDEGCEWPMMKGAMEDGLLANNAGSLAPAAAGGSVTVVSQEQVGPFDSAVIQSNDPGALKAWLRENGYVLPPTLDPLLDPYVAGKFFFLALKLRKDKDAGDLQPIAFTYRSTRPGIPIRLTGVAATKDMGVWCWLLGDSRAVPQNYRHAQINEARIDWLGGGGNYPQVVTEAMNEAGGQAFVTDYAGKSGVIPPADFDPKRFDLPGLRQTTHPVEFAEAVVERGFFGERFTTLDGVALQAFLKRWVPKPKALAQLGDDQYYRNIMSYRAQIDAEQLAVDTAKAVAELEERVVEPSAEIKAMLEEHDYLTALYTTMSPEEMSIDPAFVFNPGLPDVSNVHTAKGVRKCKPGQPPWEAPIEITLDNGFRFFTRELTDGDRGQPLAMPAALRIEQLKSEGGASLIQDNSAAVARALGLPAPAASAAPAVTPAASTAPPTARPAAVATPAVAVAIDAQGAAVVVPATAQGGGTSTRSSGGAKASGANAAAFGCAGCAATNSAPLRSGTNGAGEGLTFALFFAGLAGWRRWLGRR